MEKIVYAKNGMVSAEVAGQPLHSRYDPLSEARKFVKTLPLTGEERVFILMECGLGYIIPFIRERAAKYGTQPFIVSLHASDFFLSGNLPPDFSTSTDVEKSVSAEWSPSCGNLADFLEARIPLTEARRVKIIEWRPARAAYGAAYLAIVGETAAFIKSIEAGRRTLNFFGKRWFLNILYNASNISKVVIPQKKARNNCVVCASGPSLEAALPILRRAQESGKSPLVFAASSALPALNNAGVTPDLVVTSDGGNWALLHLAEFVRYAGYRRDDSRRVPLAYPLHAALSSSALRFSVFPFAVNQVESLMLRSAGLPVFLLPESGTVSAAALDLALGLSDGKVYVCGMDFKTRDIQTHTRPYLFDIMAGAKSTRTSPWYTRRFERALGMREGGSLDVYARWFERYEREHKERVFQFSEFKPEQNTEKLTWQDVNAVRALNERGLGRVVIEEIRREPEGAVCREVSELLFEGGEPHGIEEIEDKIVGLLKKHG